MTESEIIDAGIEYTLSTHPMCICGDAFGDDMKMMNRNRVFEAGAKWMLNQLKIIDEENLNNITKEFLRVYKMDLLTPPYIDLMNAFKAGYHKATEEIKYDSERSVRTT